MLIDIAIEITLILFKPIFRNKYFLNSFFFQIQLFGKSVTDWTSGDKQTFQQISRQVNTNFPTKFQFIFLFRIL